MNALLPNILIISGPTASGKSSLALEIAKLIPSEILSADSRQVYQHLTIGTAKPSQKELQIVPHHGIDLCKPNEKFTAWDFQSFGRKSISEILQHKCLPIVCGGTGLYIQSLIDGIFEQPEFSGNIRSALEARMAKEGKDSLYRELQKIDPIAAQTMDATKYRRVIRALEVYYETGISISQLHAQHTKDELYHVHWIALQWERSLLYQRIHNRVDEMLRNGLLDEVKQLQAMGFDDHFQALQTVGYTEAFQFLRNEISYSRMVELIKQNTRRFAKRQMTWFRKEKRIQWIPIHDESEIFGISKTVVKSIMDSSKK